MQNNNKKLFNLKVKGTILASLLVVAGIMVIASSGYVTRKYYVSSNNNEKDTKIVESVSSVLVEPPMPEIKDEAPSEIQVSSSGLKNNVPYSIIQERSLKKVIKLSLDPNRTVLLMGQVADNALDAAAEITNLAAKSKDPIYLILSGPGGSVLTGSILISAIQASNAPVYTICDILCASMDSMIHQYGKQRYMTDRTIIMFHPAAASAQGDVDRMHSMVSFLKRYTNKIEVEVSRRQGITFEQYKQKTGVELWVDAEDAVQQRIADSLVNFKMLSVPTFTPKKHDADTGDNKNKRNYAITDPLDIQWICTTSFCKGIKWETSK